MSSELSDALNPNASQARRVSYNHEYSTYNNTYNYHPYTQVPPQAPQPHVPHVSELESAIVQPPAVVAPQQPARPRQAGPMFAELARVVIAAQQAQETERKRRLAWEAEQEEKAAQRQVEMEKKLLEMEDVIASLRSRLDTVNNTLSPAAVHATEFPSPQFDPSPSPLFHVNDHMNDNGGSHPVSPISPVFRPSSVQQPMFVQGSSNPASSAGYHGHPTATDSDSQQVVSSTQVPDMASRGNNHPGIQSITPDPSPHLAFIETSRRSPEYTAGLSAKSKKRRKKNRTPSPSSDDGSASSSASSIDRPRKRHSHHDTRCYTIHHAIRLHILRLMGLENDKELPDSHTEGTNLSPHEPVRFVWDKTTKQSVHNGRMKARVLEDIKDNRRLYKHVPQKEFAKKNLDAAFEQCFVTFRQKFKVQRDASSAEYLKKREDNKARKARHLSRRRIKLSARSEARNKIEKFEHVTFDGALQLDCMSSEESDVEVDPHSSQPGNVLKIRGYDWRSTRLLRFYSTLDDEERQEALSRPKRGTARKERRTGPRKEGFILPPRGVATWMISQRWYKSSLLTHPDLHHILDKLIDDPTGFNWDNFRELGEETASEDEPGEVHQDQAPPVQPISAHMHTLDLDLHPQHYNPEGYTIDYTL